MAITDYAIIPKTDYIAACDKIREHSGKTDVIKSGYLAAEIEAIAGGGGSSADVRYVTFIGADGATLIVKPVAVGDDCADVVAKGLISTPTKESTVAEVYTYSGWSLTEGGAASSTALANVTEDRTVYAAFTATARKYTVRFYDGTTLMQESQVAYGTQATPPDTTKDGSIFVAWTPSDLTIYGDTDFVGAWAAAKYTLLDNPSDLPANLYGGMFNPDGTQLILTGKNTESNVQMYVYNVTGNTYTRLFNMDISSSGSSQQMAFSSNGTRLAIAGTKSGDYSVSVYDTTTTPYTLLGKTALDYTPRSLIYSPDETKLFVAVSTSSGMRTLDATQIPYVVTDNLIPAAADVSTLSCMVYNPDKTILAIGYDKQYTGAYFYDTTSYTQLYRANCMCRSVSFSPDGKNAVVGTNESTTPRGFVIDIDGTTVKAASSNSLSGTPIGMIFAYHPDGKRLVGMSSRGAYTRVYSTETTSYVSMSDMFEVEPDKAIGTLFYNNDGSRLFAIGNLTSRKMYIYNTEIDMVSK